jgi:hypothetical protein
VVFISIARPYDPVELCEAIVNDLIATGVNHSKWVQSHSLTCSTLLTHVPDTRPDWSQ